MITRYPGSDLGLIVLGGEMEDRLVCSLDRLTRQLTKYVLSYYQQQASEAFAKIVESSLSIYI